MYQKEINYVLTDLYVKCPNQLCLFFIFWGITLLLFNFVVIIIILIFLYFLYKWYMRKIKVIYT